MALPRHRRVELARRVRQEPDRVKRGRLARELRRVDAEAERERRQRRGRGE